MTATTPLDIVTFEVLRHRLWEINDEMGLLAGRISGSPAVYESGDFNSAILTPDGKGVFAGVYVIRQASALDLVVQAVLADFGDDIRDGDVFLTSDPWAGALHAMDAAVVAPVFWDGELVAWTGIVMHELDVGGPRPGSWSVGAADAFQEAPIMPPVRIVDAGSPRRDVERAFLRNSRTPEVNALNLRAKVASQVSTRDRLHDVIRQYGRDTFVAVQRQILDYVTATVRQRISGLPDGIFHAQTFIDHDGTNDRTYRLRLTLTKRGERLEFDFTGTDPQAPGPINCAYSGLVGGILQVLFPLLCFDVPWSHGAVWDCIDVISEPGTLNNATHPAATSMATVNACQATGDLVWEAMGRLYACSPELLAESMAIGYGGVNMAVLAGRKADGGQFVNLFTDSVGGSGARSFKDGIDTSGNLLAPAYAIPNVERIESLAPVLYAYRRQRTGTAGPGRYRGGSGLEYLVVPYGADGPIEAVFFSSGCSHPLNKGMRGGNPGSAQRNLVLRGSRILDQLRMGQVPNGWEDVDFDVLDVVAAKDVTMLDSSDCWVNFCSGGGGYGDPLDRPVDEVHSDVRHRVFTPEQALADFGVEVSPAGDVQIDQTRTRRAEARRARLVDAQPPDRPAEAGSARQWPPVGSAGPTIDVRDDGTRRYFVCAHCDTPIGPITADLRSGLAMRQVAIDEVTALNRFTAPEMFVLRAYLCSSCGTQHSTDVEPRDSAPAKELTFGTEPDALASLEAEHHG